MRKYKVKIKESTQDKEKLNNFLKFYDDHAFHGDDYYDSGSNGEKIIFSTPLKLVEHAFSIFGTAITDGHAAPEIYNWLDSLDWIDLDAWNAAKRSFNTHLDLNQKKEPSKRQIKFLAIEDCVAWVYEELDVTARIEREKRSYYLFNPRDLMKIAGLTPQHMKMTQFEVGYELASKPATTAPAKPAPTVALPKKSTKPIKKPKQTYASAVKIKQANKAKTVIGKSTANIGIKPKKLSLYLRVPTGGDISKIVETIGKRKTSKAKEIKTTLVSKTNNFNSYQLQCTVDFNKLNFWLEEGLWPTGVVAKPWFGKDAVPFEERKLKKTIFMSGIGNVEEATILNHIRNKAYPGIKFDSLAFSRIGDNNGTVTLEICEAEEMAKFRNEGLKAWLFPVKVKWFRQRLKKATGWFGAD